MQLDKLAFGFSLPTYFVTSSNKMGWCWNR